MTSKTAIPDRTGIQNTGNDPLECASGVRLLPDPDERFLTVVSQPTGYPPAAVDAAVSNRGCSPTARGATSKAPVSATAFACVWGGGYARNRRGSRLHLAMHRPAMPDRPVQIRPSRPMNRLNHTRHGLTDKAIFWARPRAAVRAQHRARSAGHKWNYRLLRLRPGWEFSGR